MFTPTGVVILLAYAFTCGFFTAYVASKKGYDGGLWFFLGLFFNFVALIAAAGLPIVTDTLTSNTVYDKMEYDKLKAELKDDKVNNEFTDEEIREKEKELERIKNKLES